MKKICIVIPWFDPAFRAGGPIRSVVNMIRSFHHEIEYKVFTSNKDIGGVILNDVRWNTWLDYNLYTKVFYSNSKFAFLNFQKQIKATKPDIIFIIGLFSFQYNLLPLLFSKASKKIISIRGMLHPGALSQKKSKKRLVIFLLKKMKIQNKVVFHATDMTEEGFIKNIFGDECEVIIANNFPQKNVYLPIHEKQPDTIKLLTVSLISKMKNHLLILKSLTTITDAIEYHVIGAVKDNEYWKLCLDLIKELPQNIKVVYHGEIHPSKIPMYLRDADVFIMPSLSENYGHSIYEALSSGRPVITSNFTPWNNLKDFKAGLNINLDIPDIRSAICFFSAMNNEEFQQWTEGSSFYAHQFVDFDSLYHQYTQLFN